MTPGRPGPRERRIARTLRERSRYPSRCTVVRADGSIYWPQPGEGALPGEILLGPVAHETDGPVWGVASVADLLVVSSSRPLDTCGARLIPYGQHETEVTV